MIEKKKCTFAKISNKKKSNSLSFNVAFFPLAQSGVIRLFNQCYTSISPENITNLSFLMLSGV